MHVCMQVGMYAQGEHWRVSLLPNTKTHYFSTCYRQEVEAFGALKHHSLTPSLFGTATLRLRLSYPSLHTEAHRLSGTRQSTQLYLACWNRGVLLHSLAEGTHISLASAHTSNVSSSVEAKAAKSLTIGQFVLQDAYLFQHKIWDPRHVQAWRRKARNANRRDP